MADAIPAAQLASSEPDGRADGQRPPKKFVGCSPISEYELGEKLGEGTFGVVFRARCKKNGADVAMKRIIKHDEKDGFPITALREIKLLKLLSHPNVLQLVEMVVEPPIKPDKRKRAYMYMVTPYMDHDLSGLLENPNVHFTEPQIKCYMQQLLEGLRYIHDNQILHRDMKAANLLINNKGILQIADFGLARHYDGPVPRAGCGGGEARRDYTTLVVTRWYRPPELLLHLRRYTTAIDLWGVGCIFGEMLTGRPIMTGDSDIRQLHMIFDLVGTPTEETMPGWRKLPGAAELTLQSKPPTLSQRFREYGSGAISLLNELMRLDWRKRINAIDALEHPYFKNEPYPAQPHELPTFEASHEFDRQRFRQEKAARPPAPKGGTVGMGPNGGWGGEDNRGGNAGFGNGHGDYGGVNRAHQNVSRHPPPQRGHRNGVAHPPPVHDRQPAWARNAPRNESRPPPPPRGPPPNAHWGGPGDGSWSDRTDGHRDRDRDMDRDRGYPRNRGVGPPRPPADIDTYIPSYGPDSGRRDDRPLPRDDRALPPRPRDDRPRDDRRRWDDREDRGKIGRDRDRLDYDDRMRVRGAHSRSRSPMREREWDRDMDRDRGYRR